MIDDPESDDEFVFASDFYARKFNGRRTGLCTQLLRASQAITVDDTWRGNPEAGVAGVMRLVGKGLADVLEACRRSVSCSGLDRSLGDSQ